VADSYESANIRFVFDTSGVAGQVEGTHRNVQDRLVRVWKTRTSQQIYVQVRLVQLNSAGTVYRLKFVNCV
jgi:hypothetical protein